MLIQRLIPTSVRWGSQERNCNPNTNTSRCQETANAASHCTELSECFKRWWIHRFGKSSNICSVNSTNISFFQKESPCFGTWMRKWTLESTHVEGASQPFVHPQYLQPLQSICCIFFPFRKRRDHSRVLLSKNEGHIESLFRELCAITSFKGKDRGVFTLKLIF